MISRAVIDERVREWGLREDVIEKDYVLGWLLWGIGGDPELGARWVFKGGTCLKKCYIETYRFSEDLDFTVLPRAGGAALAGRGRLLLVRGGLRREAARDGRALPTSRPLRHREPLSAAGSATPASGGTGRTRGEVRNEGSPDPDACGDQAVGPRRRAGVRVENMLGHQLPALPPFEQFWEELESLFAWLEGRAVEPAPERLPVEGDEDPAWTPPATVTTWRVGVPLEVIRFAAVNHLCVELGYQGTTRLIEPYSLRRTRAGNLVLHALRADSKQHRSYRVDKIESARATNRPFTPTYAVEFSSAGPLAAPLQTRRARRTRPRPAHRRPRRR